LKRARTELTRPRSHGGRATYKEEGAVAAGAGAAAAAAVAAGCATTTNDDDDDDSDDHLDGGLLGKLKKQWLDFKRFVNVVGDARAATSSNKTKPARYWIRMRPFWKELSEMMLFWLAVPISTACVERGFSHMTCMDRP
jgi:hypothetical protein